MTSTVDMPRHLDCLRIELVSAHSPERLLQHAAEPLLVAPSARSGESPRLPTCDVLLVLRQGGLRDDLLALAARKRVPGWLDPPVATFHELPLWLGSSDRIPLTDWARAVLVQRLMREHGGDSLSPVAAQPGFIDAVDRLLGELGSAGVTPEAFHEAVRLSAPFRDPVDLTRDETLATIYHAWVDLLQASRVRDGRATLADTATFLSENPAEVSRQLGTRRQMHIVGLTDLRGGWRQLLAVLDRTPCLDRVVLYAAPGILEAEGLRPARITVLPEPLTATALPARLFTPSERGEPTCTVARITAPDPQREAEEVVHRIRILVDRGVPMHRIAVVSRRARPTTDLVLGTLARAGLSGSARRRMTLGEIPVVRALTALFTAAADGWTRHGLVSLARQPYFRHQLDPDTLNRIGFESPVRGLAGWRGALLALEGQSRAERTGAADSGETRRLRAPPPRIIRRAREGFEQFDTAVHEIDPPRPLAHWLRWLERFLADDPLEIGTRIWEVPEKDWDLARVDLAGWRGVTTAVREWRAALDRWSPGDGDDAPISVRAFRDQLRNVLSGDVALWTPVRKGVQVLEALAATGRSWEHLFLMGMNAGEFPVSPSISPLLHEEDRDVLHRAGLPLDGNDRRALRERHHFRLLVGSAEHLTVSRSGRDAAGRETLPSPFLDTLSDVAEVTHERIGARRVITPGIPFYPTSRALFTARHTAEVERDRARARPGLWSGLITRPDLLAILDERFGDGYAWSPSSLESHAKCPWSWFAQRLLRLERGDDPGDEADPAARGTLWHDTLRRFFDRAAQHGGSPVVLDRERLESLEPVLDDVLGEAWEVAISTGWLGPEALHEVTRASTRRALWRYLEWEVEEIEKERASNRGNAPKRLRTGVAHHELTFEDVVLERNGVRMKYRGTIDRVEFGVDERVPNPENWIAAVDYKSSKWSTPGSGSAGAWGDEIVLQIPLYAHALRSLYPEARIARTEYRAVKSREAVHVLQLATVDWKTGAIVPDADAAMRLETSLDAVVAHVRSIRGGVFPIAVPPSCTCPPWCPGRDICRIPGGPREAF